MANTTAGELKPGRAFRIVNLQGKDIVFNRIKGNVRSFVRQKLDRNNTYVLCETSIAANDDDGNIYYVPVDCPVVEVEPKKR